MGGRQESETHETNQFVSHFMPRILDQLDPRPGPSVLSFDFRHRISMNFGAYKFIIFHYQISRYSRLQDISKWQKTFGVILKRFHITWKLVILETVLTQPCRPVSTWPNHHMLKNAQELVLELMQFHDNRQPTY